MSSENSKKGEVLVKESNQGYRKYLGHIILGITLISMIILIFYFNDYFTSESSIIPSGVAQPLTEEQLLEKRPEKPVYNYTDTNMYTALFYITEDIKYTYDGLYRMTNLDKSKWKGLNYNLNTLKEEIRTIRVNLELVANTYTGIDTSLLISLDNSLHSLSATIEGYEADADMTSIKFTLSKSMGYLVPVVATVTTFMDTDGTEED